MTIDSIYRATADHPPMRLVLIQSTDAANRIAQFHDARGGARRLLGEIMMGSLLLASRLKGQGTVQVKMEFTGDLTRASADATPLGLVRAMIPWDELRALGDFEAVVLPRMMQVRQVDADGRMLSESRVEMTTSDATEAFTHYLVQSELPHALILLQSSIDSETGLLNRCCGLLVEGFPNLIPEQWPAYVEAIRAGSTSAFDRLTQGEDPPLVLASLLPTSGIALHGRFEVEPFCPCTRERLIRALASLPRPDLEDLMVGSENLEVHCDFCRRPYQVSVLELEELLKKDPLDPETDVPNSGLPT